MMNTLDVSIMIGIFFRTLALLILGLNILPRVWAESKVPNGLGMLRRIIFYMFFIFFFLNAFVLIINIGRILDLFAEDITGIMAIVAGLSHLLLSGALYLVYNHDYGRLKK